MKQGEQSNATNGSESVEPVLEWTTHPVKRRPWVSVLVTLFVFVVGILVFYTTDSRAFAVLALVVMFLSLAKFYFPTTYRLSPDGVTIKTTTQTLRKEWSIYRSCYADKKGILLSPFVQPSRLENFRGIYLMFNENSEEVTAFVKEHIGKRRDSDSEKSGPGRSGSERSEPE
jgi:hypothetical protein